MIIKKSQQKKKKKKIVGDSRKHNDKQVRYRNTKTFPIAITRIRKMEFSNPTLQVKFEHDPGM